MHVQALARTLFALALGEAAKARAEDDGAAPCADCARLRSEVALLRTEAELLRARFGRIPAATRPRFSPSERQRAIDLMAARGWNRHEAAAAPLVTPPTISRWVLWAEQGAPGIGPRAPVNKFPDLVTEVLQRLKASFPDFGKRRLAWLLARAGLQLSATTVMRKLRERPLPAPKGPSPTPGSATEPSLATGKPQRSVTASCPGHVWGLDLTLVPTFVGFWISWLPFSVPLGWPFCWHVLGVVGFFSRKSLELAVFSNSPSADDVALALDRAVKKAGKAPKHLVSDKGCQFWSAEAEGPTEALSAWKTRHGVRLRFGALGKHGSIAVVERFWRSLKTEWTRRILVPFGLDAMQVDLESYARWYNTCRPHQGIGGATPEERHRQVTPARDLLRLEVRERYPLHEAHGSPAEARRATLRGLRVAQLDEHERLPLVLLDCELRDAA